jgi:hypothetical protein
MAWTTNKILLYHTQSHTPCKDIFQAVCDEIGAFYSKKGYTYTASRPKIAIEKNDIRLEICFFSTRTNVVNQSVSLQIIPTFYSKKAKTSDNPKGIVLAYPDIFYTKTEEMPPKLIVNELFGGQIINTENWRTESEIRDYHVCEVYGLDEEKFFKIIDFIERKVLDRFDELIGILEQILLAR